MTQPTNSSEPAEPTTSTPPPGPLADSARSLERIRRRRAGGTLRRIPYWSRRLLRASLWGVLAVYFIFCSVVLVLRHHVLPNIDDYRPSIERAAAAALGTPVEVTRVAAGWQGLRPRLSLHDVAVFDATGRVALRLPKVEATLSWESLALAQLRLHSLEIQQADLGIRRDAKGALFVAGLPVDLTDKRDSVAEWILAQPEIVIRNSRVRWNDELRRAPELILNELNFVLQRSGRRHRFGLWATPPAARAAPVDIRGEFLTPVFAQRMADSQRWRGRVYLRVAHIDLSAWAVYIDYPFGVTRGAGALRTWIDFSEASVATDTRAIKLLADVRLTGVHTRLGKDLPPLQLTNLNGRLSASVEPGQRELQMQNFNLRTVEGQVLRSNRLQAKLISAAGNRPESGEFSTDTLNLETLAALAERIPLGVEVRRLLEQYRPRGRVDNVSLTWQGPVEKPIDFDFSANFDGLSLRAQAAAKADEIGQPGFVNLSGSVQGGPRGGKAMLSSTRSILSFPGVFAQPDIPLARIDGQFLWASDGNNLEVQASNVRFENDDAAGHATATWRRGTRSATRADGPGWLELTGQLTRADARRVPRYLPLDIDAEIRNWLARAIIAGTSSDTTFEVRGDLDRFPFTAAAVTARASGVDGVAAAARRLTGASRDNEEFRVTARLRQVRFDYSQQEAKTARWPVLEDVEATLAFHGSRMEVQQASGRIANVRFDRTLAALPDMDADDPVLEVNGSLNGALQDYLRFVGSSPVGEMIGGMLDGARGAGAAQLDLRLALPLNRMDATKVTGGLVLGNNDLTLDNGLPPLQRIGGRVDFTESQLALRNVAGQFLGGPFRLEGETAANGQINLRGDGNVAVAQLRRALDNRFMQNLTDRMSGNLRYTLALGMRPPSAAPGASGTTGTNATTGSTARRLIPPPTVVIESNLAGLAIDLPAPVRKHANETMALRIEAQPQGINADQIRISLGPSVRMAFQRARDKSGQLVVTRAAYGVNEEAYLSDTLGHANINLKSLDIDAWQTAIEALNAVPAAGGLSGPAGGDSLIPDVIAVRASELRLFDKSLANVVFAASRDSNQWQANINADQISGYLTWRPGSGASQQGRIGARLARLIIPKDAASEVTSVLSSPREIPALDIIADQFELRGKKFGRLELIAENTRSGARREWHLSTLTLTMPEALFESNGVWAPDASGAQRTSLDIRLTTNDSGRLLERLEMKDTVRGGRGTLTGKVRWNGSPLSIDYASLDGNLTLDAENGQFLKADPGISKLLGVLSLQGLPRRISLDFRDVFSEGFRFDSIRATAALQDGIATTRDFNMRGVSANVLIEGSADLARETQSLHVLVLPLINAGAGSIAYALFANPVIGLATFIAQAILKDPISRALSFEYNVTGTWVNPNITKLERRYDDNTGEPIPSGSARSNRPPGG